MVIHMYEGPVYWDLEPLCSLLLEQAETSTWSQQTLTILVSDSINTS